MIYLDNSATTCPFSSVVDVMSQSMREAYFNASAAYGPAIAVDKEIKASRAVIASALGARAEEVIFTSGGTEGDNLAILGVAQGLRKPANFVCSSIEHPAVLETIHRVEKLGHEVRILPIDARGIVDLSACEALIDEHTALVSCMQVSNETGAVQPIDALVRMARRKNPDVRIHVDGVQGFLRVPMHMERMGVDFYALSGHKIHGPKGVGALVVRGGARLVPQMTGGGQEKGLRSGTYNAPGILGLGEAVHSFMGEPEAILRLNEMKVQLWNRLQTISGVYVNGPMPLESDSAPHILSLSFDGVRGEVMRNALEGEGILVSTGSACASHKQKVSPVLRAMGLTPSRADGTVRVSLGLMNTMQEMDEAAEKMASLYSLLSKYQRR